MENMILVFKTSVQTLKEVEHLRPHINTLVNNTKWNFDLEDCDNIFRVENCWKEVNLIISFFKSFGFDCEELF